jgi:hypothetical protein
MDVMRAVQPRLTYPELRLMPDDGKRYELIDGRSRTYRARLIGTLLLLVPLALPSAAAASDIPLKLLISVEQQDIVAPFPARVTLHLHNAGNDTVWLYRHTRGKLPAPRRLLEEDTGPAQSMGGSMLAVKLEPARLGQAAISNPAQGTAFESVGLPKPRLIRLAPGEDYEEKTSIRLTPALSEVQKPIWGTYRLSIIYTAQYSNAEEIQRVLKVTVWQGEVSSNTIEVQLQPPSPESRGQVSGTVNTPDSVPIRDAIVSLTDQTEHLVDQTTSDPEGRYSFSNLPPGLYWVTTRRDGATEDTEVFRHVQLTVAELSATQDLVMIPQEIYESKKMLRKPVLFRVWDSAGRPSDRVGLEVTWSTGTLLDNVKGETGSDGTVALELIPGRSFVTLKRHGCPKQDERADVVPGEGIDGFEYTFECAKK